jgi:hypothetical protein
MVAVIAPISWRQAEYADGRRENARAKFGTWPRAARSVAYMSATGPAASFSENVSMNIFRSFLGRAPSPAKSKLTLSRSQATAPMH